VRFFQDVGWVDDIHIGFDVFTKIVGWNRHVGDNV